MTRRKKEQGPRATSSRLARLFFFVQFVFFV